jgi:glycosyltransferase involved in cell wall biosynthesis
MFRLGIARFNQYKTCNSVLNEPDQLPPAGPDLPDGGHARGVGMKICVIGVRGLPGVVGGIETYCAEIYPRIARWRRDLAVTIITRTDREGRRRYALGDADVIVLPTLPFRGIDVPLHTLLALLYARLVLRSEVVAIQGIGPGFFAAFARALGFRTVVTHHAPDFERPKWGVMGRWFLRTGERIACGAADRVICVSEALRQALVARHPRVRDRAVAIRNGGGLPRATSGPKSARPAFSPPAGPYVLAVGRLEATKGFADLVAAFRSAARPDLTLVIAGTAAPGDPYAEALLREADARVVFAGAVFGDDLRRLYGGAALFVHPSRMEGHGIVVSEALGEEIPVIVSDIPPHREYQLDPGCYFPAGDVEALAERLAAPDFSVFRSPRAIALNRGHTWESSARAHLRVLEGVAGRLQEEAAAPATSAKARQ